MKDLKLVNYKTHRGHDGYGFNADLVLDGKKIAHVHDDAWGGEYQYDISVMYDDPKYKEYKQLFDKLEAEIKAEPKIKTDYGTMDNCLDFVINDICKEMDRKKDEKKGVMVENASGWQIFGFKTSIPTTIKNYSDGLEALQGVYDKQKKAGSKILNMDYLKSVGISL